MEILKRNIFNEVKAHIFQEEVTILTGARQVGKTTLLKSLKNSLNIEGYINYYFTLERYDIKTLLDQNPENLFLIIPNSSTKKIYVFIDEIQYLKNPTNFLKLIFDEYKEKIKLIVTASSAFYIDRKFKDSLVGRKRIFHLSPFSFKETLLSKGHTELSQYVENGINSQTEIPIMYINILKKEIEEYLVYGGYPKVVLSEDYNEKQIVLSELVNSFLKKDALESNIRKETEFMHFVEVLADRTGNKINRNELANICNISDETVQNFLYILNKSFHISYVRPFWKSKTSELRKMPKFYFQDNGLRNAILNDFTPLVLRKDKGELVENLAYNLLRKHYAPEQIQYWNTREQNEVDFILNKEIALEIKYSCSTIKKHKYKLFKQTYPEISLKFACVQNISNQIPIWTI